MAGAFIAFGLVGAMPDKAWSYSFTLFSITSLVAVVFATFAIPETLAARRGDKGEEKFRMLPGYRRILAVIFIAAFAGALIQPYYLVYLRSRFGLELYWLATAFLPVGLAYAVLPVVLGKATASMRRASAMSLGLVLAGGFYALVPSVGHVAAVIAVFAGAAVGGVLVELTRNAWVGDLSPPGASGKTFGLAMLAAGAGASLGPLAGGAIYDGLGPAWLFYLAAILFGASAFWLMQRRRQSGSG